ncbi:MAG: ATP-binding protein [Nanoarchaeota archaeon]|nr:ATP-binding protein [Nanoarchaeota archaeon]
MATEIVIGRTQSDFEKYGTEGTIFIGKQYIKMGDIMSLANKVLLDVVRPHVILVAGKRGEGKSYTLAQIAEGMAFFLPKEISQNIALLFLDTMGIFWTMKFPNYRDEALLHKWGLEPKGLKNVKLFVPGGKFDELKEKGIPVDEKFYLTTSEIEPLEWCFTFGIKPTDAEGILITRVVSNLRKSGELFDIDDIVNKIKEDKEADEKTKASAITRFESVKDWGLFAKKGTELLDILQGGIASVLDISIYTHIYGAFSIRDLVIALFSKKILEQREAARKIEEKEEVERGYAYFGKREIKKKKVPLVWIFIDEVHEFLPLQGKTLATGPLLQIIREGRQPGISLVVATQQPGKMNTDVLSQCDIVISHRVTSKMDIEALNSIMQSFMTQTLAQALDELPRVKGCALILDQNQERVYRVQMRPRFSWHGGETPTAIPPKPKEI